jgi:hypothetical protein
MYTMPQRDTVAGEAIAMESTCGDETCSILGETWVTRGGRSLHM